jgi:hypothetical protein
MRKASLGPLQTPTYGIQEELPTPTRPVGLVCNLNEIAESKTVSIATRASNLLSFERCARHVAKIIRTSNPQCFFE